MGAARPLLPAPVGPLASAVIVRRFGDQIEEMARRFELQGSMEAVAVAAQLRDGLARMAESARMRNLAQAGNGSGGGTSEPRQVAGPAVSVSPPSDHLTVAQVAERLKVSPEYVRRLCRTGRLSATKQGRDWLIDPESAADWTTARSTR